MCHKTKPNETYDEIFTNDSNFSIKQPKRRGYVFKKIKYTTDIHLCIYKCTLASIQSHTHYHSDRCTWTCLRTHPYALTSKRTRLRTQAYIQSHEYVPMHRITCPHTLTCTHTYAYEHALRRLPYGSYGPSSMIYVVLSIRFHTFFSTGIFKNPFWTWGDFRRTICNKILF